MKSNLGWRVRVTQMVGVMVGAMGDWLRLQGKGKGKGKEPGIVNVQSNNTLGFHF